MMKVKLSHEEDVEEEGVKLFELEEGLCSCELDPLPKFPKRSISEMWTGPLGGGPTWDPGFIFVQIESGPKHPSDFSVPACRKCRKLMVSKVRLERHRDEEPLSTFIHYSGGFPVFHQPEGEGQRGCV